MIVAFLFAVGLVIGSFLNVVVWRVPRAESIVRPPSACPACGHEIRRRDNVPVLSWLNLRGRCRDCRAAISPRYPLVELGTAVLFALVALRFGVSAAALAYLYLAAIGVCLALIDFDTRRLPDAIVLPSYPVLAVLLAVASWGSGDWPALLRALIGGVVLWAAYFLLVVAYPAGMGFGDVKLAGLLGAALAWLGWGELAVGGFAAFLLGGVFSVGLLLSGRANRKSGIPFGPWMLLGAAIGIGFGGAIWTGYLDLVL
ncbi:prepilin peptidase [Pengzhenrongella sicca]|uniref:Prepilin leader peptidase/N-methyltransferase n=1 Tax=Pengzhenrongella sicca TaxID=2819238 RepID=A0A8A4Z9A5_9MICO|nr:A24 family peptidase [Pengzhenrongella sicca]QTE28011.1 prepilin peptidase [Pengzhenrongella sicca]